MSEAGMSQEEWSSRYDDGEDPYALSGEAYQRMGWVYDEETHTYSPPEEE